jgi:hypothetical protein
MTFFALATASLWAGQEVQTPSDPKDTKQLEVASVDAKQIEATDVAKKPAWLTDVSVSVKETYDSNVFLTNADRAGLPPVANVSSWVTSVTPKVGFDFAPLINDPVASNKSIEVLSLAYAPEVVRYHDAATENYEAHRITTQIKGKADSFSYNFDNLLSFVEGNRDTPQYNQVNCWATTAVRERRDQMQDKGKLILRNDWEQWFVRGTGSVTYYDLNTYQVNNNLPQYAGWQDYVDRYDTNGGLDFGYKITKDFAVTLGYRRGHQYQQAFSWSSVSNTNDYDRALAGFEGKPLKWLKVEFQGGPDFHSYGDTIAAGHQNDLTRAYLEGAVSAEVTSRDTLGFRMKQWQWVSSTGTASYEDKTFDFSYKRKLADKLTGSLGYLIQGAVYDAPTVRNDWQYTYTAGLKYDLNEHLSFTGDYSFIQGVDDSYLNIAPGREYDRHLVTLGMRAAF